MPRDDFHLLAGTRRRGFDWVGRLTKGFKKKRLDRTTGGKGVFAGEREEGNLFAFLRFPQGREGGASVEAGGFAVFGVARGLRVRREGIEEGHPGDALALRGEEGRSTLRKARGRCERSVIPGFPNGATHPWSDLRVSSSETIGGRGEPGELKHLSSRRKGHQEGALSPCARGHPVRLRE